jgi:cobalt-zinc-cadmium efflux system outer membrane protein
MAAAQSEMQYEAIELQIGAEVAQAYHTYEMACRQVAQFNSGLLDGAEIIFKKKMYSYERGETGIFELLHAQRTYNDIQINYSETLYHCAVALVELERACGIVISG